MENINTASGKWVAAAAQGPQLYTGLLESCLLLSLMTVSQYASESHYELPVWCLSTQQASVVHLENCRILKYTYTHSIPLSGINMATKSRSVSRCQLCDTYFFDGAISHNAYESTTSICYTSKRRFKTGLARTCTLKDLWVSLYWA